MIISNRQKKIMANKMEQEKFLEEKKNAIPLKRWEDAQIKAAGIQSALDYAIDQFNQHKEELDEEVVKQAEEQIELRKKEIEEFLMTEKDLYLAAIQTPED